MDKFGLMESERKLSIDAATVCLIHGFVRWNVAPRDKGTFVCLYSRTERVRYDLNELDRFAIKII
jgi:hypothetical protein